MGTVMIIFFVLVAVVGFLVYMLYEPKNRKYTLSEPKKGKSIFRELEKGECVSYEEPLAHQQMFSPLYGDMSINVHYINDTHYRD